MEGRDTLLAEINIQFSEQDQQGKDISTQTHQALTVEDLFGLWTPEDKPQWLRSNHLMVMDKDLTS